MVASTFTRSLSAAPALLSVLPELIARGDRYWLLTLHPKCPPPLFDAYRALAGAHARFLESPDVVDMLRAADVLVCDTSSVIEECVLLDKPVVTLRTRRPQPYLLDVQAPEQVDAAIDAALARPPAQMQAAREYGARIHPSRDGHAAQRVVAATERLLEGGFGPLRSPASSPVAALARALDDAGAVRAGAVVARIWAGHPGPPRHVRGRVRGSARQQREGPRPHRNGLSRW